MKKVASVDIGGTQTRVAIIDENYNIVDKIVFETDGDNPTKTMDDIANYLNGKDEDIEVMTLCCPGPLDFKNGVVLQTPNLPGWHYFEIVNEIKKRLPLTVLLDNDANLAGLAEATIGAGKGHNIVQYLTISTGIGGGIVINGEILHGSRGYACEMANIILMPKGFKVGFLSEGSLESIGSGTGIYQRALNSGLDVKSTGEVFELSKTNPIAKEIIEDAKEIVANAIAAIYGIIDPDIVVIGGGVANNVEGYIPDILNRVKHKVLEVVRDDVKVVNAQLGDDCGLIGGGVNAFKYLESNK